MTLPSADLIAAAMVRALDTVPETLPPPREMPDKLLLEVMARRLRDAEEKLATANAALYSMQRLAQAGGADLPRDYPEHDAAIMEAISEHERSKTALASKEPRT